MYVYLWYMHLCTHMHVFVPLCVCLCVCLCVTYWGTHPETKESNLEYWSTTLCLILLKLTLELD